MRKFNLIFCAFLLLMTLARAQNQMQTANDAALEKHVMAVSEQLRCLVCQNQTIADSHAELAIDLRNQVREKIQQGMSDQDIFNYMVDRYGDFVLYRPPLRTTTWLLWFGPFLLMIGGLAFLYMKLSGRVRVDEGTGHNESTPDDAGKLPDQKETS